MAKSSSSTSAPETPPVAEAPPESGADLLQAQVRDVAERLGQMEGQVANFMEQVGSSITMLVKKFERSYEPAAMEIGGNGMAQFDETAAEPTLIHTDDRIRTDIESPAFKQKAEELRFMADMVAVQVGRPQYENAPPFIDVSVNNRTWRFGGPKDSDWDREYIIPRYILAQILQLRPFSYGNEEYTQRDGTRAVRHPRATVRKLNIIVRSDPAGQRGLDWARKLQAMPA